MKRVFKRFRHRLHRAWYWLKCRVWHRYNTVVCYALPPTWCDRDYLLLYAAFQILEDFIVKEQPWEFTADVYTSYLECNEGEAHRRAADWQMIRELYAWWQGRKNKDVFNPDDYCDDSVMLHKLIDIREYLWT